MNVGLSGAGQSIFSPDTAFQMFQPSKLLPMIYLVILQPALPISVILLTRITIQAVIRDVLVSVLIVVSRRRIRTHKCYQQDFSRLESKNIVLEQLPLDIVELVDGTLDQISQDAVAKNIGA